MKKLLLLSCLLLSTFNLFANKIDSLTDDKQVAFFLKLLIEKNYEHAKVESLEIESWQKLDFNNDKQMDLLTLIKWNHSTNPNNFIVIDKGSNNYQLILLRIGDEGKLINVIKPNKNSPLIIYSSKHYFQTERREWKGIIHMDTLIYRYLGFAELNKKPAHYQIDSIIYQQSGCFGDCPVFKIGIDRLGNATYLRLNKNTFRPKSSDQMIARESTAKSVIKKDELQDIYNLISYINFKKLKDNYAVNWTDDATYTITVKFADGDTKKISDYGAQGTFGLMALYAHFYALFKIQDWK